LRYNTDKNSIKPHCGQRRRKGASQDVFFGDDEKGEKLSPFIMILKRGERDVPDSENGGKK